MRSGDCHCAFVDHGGWPIGADNARSQATLVRWLQCPGLRLEDVLVMTGSVQGGRADCGWYSLPECCCTGYLAVQQQVCPLRKAQAGVVVVREHQAKACKVHDIWIVQPVFAAPVMAGKKLFGYFGRLLFPQGGC